jgi:hypothetical protein
MSELFVSTEECDAWAEQQTKLAARWNLQKTADLGNRPIVRVPIISPDGRAEEISLPINTAQAVDQRLHDLLARSVKLAGYREDRSRQRQAGFVRSLRFD